MTRFRPVVVGCGAVSHYWLPTLCARADVEIVAVVDAAPERAHAAVAEHGLTCVRELPIPSLETAGREYDECRWNLR